jgi:hypothetical protein
MVVSMLLHVLESIIRRSPEQVVVRGTIDYDLMNLAGERHIRRYGVHNRHYTLAFDSKEDALCAMNTVYGDCRLHDLDEKWVIV